MRPVLTPDEMAAADRRAVAAGTPVEVLMDRAGRAVAWSMRRRLGRASGLRVVIAAGKGNNGGDGLVAARVLRGWGARVDVFRVGEGIDRAALLRAVSRADVAVDAMYGTGFRGELGGDAGEVRDAFAAFDGPVFAVDIPSGVDGLTGAVSGAAVAADVTVTFAAPKTGLCFEPGRTLAGVVEVADIGIDVEDPDSGPGAYWTEAVDVCRWVRPRDAAAHKWSAGVLVIGGSGGMTGAPALAAHAALRAGAGIVWCAVPGHDAAARMSGTEVISRALAAGADGALAPSAAGEVLSVAARFRAVAIGPGLGRTDAAAEAVRRIVADLDRPLVVDADGLHALAGRLDLLRGRSAPTVVTPHEGEYAALCGRPVGPDRLAAARALAADTGAVVLLKGPGTVVANPDGLATVCPLGGPWLASAGTGDVLTGIVAAFSARDAGPFGAASAAAFVHAAAADRAGHTGLVAGDLVDALPLTLESVLEGAT